MKNCESEKRNRYLLVTNPPT